MGKMILNLEDYSIIPQEVTSLNTRTWGFVIREKTDIERLISQYEKIDIVFPWHVTSLSVDFIEELMEKIVIALKGDVKEVLNRFRLLSSRNYNFDPYLKVAVSQVTKKI